MNKIILALSLLALVQLGAILALDAGCESLKAEIATLEQQQENQ